MEEEFDIMLNKREAFLPFYASGLVAGMSSILVSHPADTIKTRIQLSTSQVSASSIVSDIYKKAGVKGFFKGVSSPLVGRAPLSALFFTAHEIILPVLESASIESKSSKAFLAGSLAALALQPVIIPVELFKCRAQAWEGADKFSMKKAFKASYRKQGLKGIYRGGLITMSREVPGSGILLATKEILEAKFNVHEETRTGMLMTKKIVAAGCAGLCAWCISIPLDTIKTIVQGDCKQE